MITIVSGLPRSGTSLMMQMLRAGGVPILTDDERLADADNPRGYLEWQAVANLAKTPELIAEAEDKAVKVISRLLFYLPSTLPRKAWGDWIPQYKILFMERPLAEVLDSMQIMARNHGIADETEGAHGKVAIQAALARFRREVDAWSAKQPNIEIMRVQFHASDSASIQHRPRRVVVSGQTIGPVAHDRASGPEALPQPGR